ncbi:hypothetical protein OPV22_025979 [Ensete ventricosum]|uniref:Uncharacterized protein n=1 Tax=Ensete ventricosum TaxID=4639 RepID=A0AAV8Q8X1_ENSVE|nr:hypothetical protein OPV22_025979 [Ensete ventricosum]
MRRRWARAGLVACLILCFAGLHGFAPSVSRKNIHHRQKADEYRTSAKASAADVVNIHPHKCKLKRIDLCSYFTPAEKNESLVEDDKRLVPTGPNPLHNK